MPTWTLTRPKDYDRKRAEYFAAHGLTADSDVTLHWGQRPGQGIVIINHTDGKIGPGGSVYPWKHQAGEHQAEDWDKRSGG